MEMFLGAVLLIGFAAWVVYKAITDEPPPPNPHLVCPHCQSKGTVSSEVVVRKQGVSGGKATAGLLTGGISLVMVGLSRKQPITAMSCSNCGTTWDVA